MATAAKTSENAWKAKLTWAIWECESLRDAPDDPDAGEAKQEERRSPGRGKAKRAKEVVTLTIPVCFVDFVRPDCERIRFRITRLKNGRFTFSDRDAAGHAHPRHNGPVGNAASVPARTGHGRWLSTAFKVEAGPIPRRAERAEELVRQIANSRFFSGHL